MLFEYRGLGILFSEKGQSIHNETFFYRIYFSEVDTEYADAIVAAIRVGFALDGF